MASEKIDADDLLKRATKKHNIHLNVLVAETSLWASPKVHFYLVEENGVGTFFPNVRRYRAGEGEKKGQVINGIRLDDNSYANHAIKRSIGIARENLKGFESCHIWPLSCYDELCHTVIANLVLLPRALAGLTDHDEEIQDTLKYRSFELYGWYPKNQKEPLKPSSYPTNWLSPYEFTPQVEKALHRRKASILKK